MKQLHVLSHQPNAEYDQLNILDTSTDNLYYKLTPFTHESEIYSPIKWKNAGFNNEHIGFHYIPPLNCAICSIQSKQRWTQISESYLMHLNSSYYSWHQNQQIKFKLNLLQKQLTQENRCRINRR